GHAEHRHAGEQAGDQRFTNGTHGCLSFLERLGRLLLVTAMWQFPGAFFLCAVCILGGPLANALDGSQESFGDPPNVTSCRGEASAGEGCMQKRRARRARVRPALLAGARPREGAISSGT